MQPMSKYAVMRFRGRSIPANEYHAPILPEYAGPYNEVLPKILESKGEIVDVLTVLPEQTWHGSQELRLHMLGRIDDIRVPTSYQIEVFRSVSRMIRDGYKGRNPADPRYLNQLKTKLDATEAKIKEISTSDFTKDPSVVLPVFPDIEFDENDPRLQQNPTMINTLRKLISGISGIGKTEGLYLALRHFPQIITHSRYPQPQGRRFTAQQLAWLKLECPPDGSLKSLCCGFLLAVDSLLGTNFYRYYAQNGRANKTQLAMGVAIVASITGLGLLVLDHVETLAVIKSGLKRNFDDVVAPKSQRDRATDELIAFMLLLDNLLGIPIMFVGTPPARDILMKRNFSLLRRMIQDGEMAWSRMLPEKENRQSWQDWLTLLDTLWVYQYTDKPFSLDNQFIHTMYDYSQGITAIAVALYKRSQYRAISTSAAMTPDLIKSVFYDEFAALEKPLEGIRKNDKKILILWEDIYHNFFDAERRKLALNLQNFDRLDTSENSSSYDLDLGFFAPNPLPPQSTSASPKLMQSIEGLKAPREIYEKLKISAFIRPMSDFLGD